MTDAAQQNVESNSQFGEIDPAMLAELTRALLPYLGPYSITTVKRASRTTSDPAEAVRLVARQIDDVNKRDQFLRVANRILQTSRPETGVASVSANKAKTQAQVNTGGRPPTPITPDLMQRGEAALAPIIGPLAGVLVSRYARAAENSRDFFERLASHLRSQEERSAFFLSIRESGPGATSRQH